MILTFLQITNSYKYFTPPGEKCGLVQAAVNVSKNKDTHNVQSFRNVYNSVIIAAARNGKRIQQKIGDVVLRPGDTLLMEARHLFRDQQRNSRDMFSSVKWIKFQTME